VPGLGPVRFKRLLDYFGTAERAWSANGSELRDAGLDSRVIESFLIVRATRSLDRLCADVEAAGAHVVTWESHDYPDLLREIYNPPPVLYVRGTLSDQDNSAVAVVGTRQCTAYGKQVTERFVTDLVANGLTVVSGLALGIDAVAHRVAVEQSGRTIAVLGSGVDVAYPAANARLMERVVEHGAVVSEYPVGSKPEAANFPARNRIIAGLARCTLVVEAANRSGALITARMALDMNREVCAVPGNVFSPKSDGTNTLIQRGEAKLVMNVQDVLAEMNVTVVTQQMAMKELVPLDATETLVLAYLGAEPTHVDELARLVSLPVREVSGTLLLMELRGMVRSSGGMTFVRTR